MSWITWLIGAVLSGGAVCLLLGRRNAPADRDAWERLLNEESHRTLGHLELELAADGAMARDAITRAMKAKDTLAFGEAIRLVDIACSVTQRAAQDRVTRLRGMALAVRMASAILPLRAVRAREIHLPEVRGVLAVGNFAHHFLVTAAERWLLRLALLRFAYQLTARAMRGGAESVHANPVASAAWARCDAAVKDWTVQLDPALVEAWRRLVASAAQSSPSISDVRA